MLSGRFRRGGGITMAPLVLLEALVKLVLGAPVACGLELPERRPARVGETGECILCERMGRGMF